jgi:protein-tyrosine phosphatase
VIDLHCHLLPGLDDGPRSMSEALALTRAAAAAGTSTIVATPHINRHWRVEPLELAARTAQVRDAIAQEGIELEVRSGGEIAITRMADLRPEQRDALRLGGGPYLLLECPLEPATWDFDVALAKLHERGQAILLAHPERCPLFQREPERLVRLVEAGLLCSITAGSMWGQFGERVREFTIALLHAELVHDVASDAHDAEHRPPGLGAAFASVEPELPGIGAQAEWLTRLAPAAILAGERLPPRPLLPGVQAAERAAH